MFKLLKDEDCSAFAHHKTVARSREGARGGLGRVVAGREGVHGVEATYAGRENGSLRTAGDESVGLAEADIIERVDDGVVRRSAGAHHAVVGAVVAILHRHMAGSDVGDHLGDEEGVVFGTLLFIERIVTGFLLEGVEAADTGGYDNAYPVAVEVGSLLQAGVGHGLTGGHERILTGRRGRADGVSCGRYGRRR